MIDNKEFITKLRIQQQDRKASWFGICEVCGETNPLCLKKFFEDHHESTRASFPKDTRVLCLNCHWVVTHSQRAIPPEWRDKQLSLDQRIDFILLSHAAIRRRMDEKEEDLIRRRCLLYSNENSNTSSDGKDKERK